MSYILTDDEWQSQRDLIKEQQRTIQALNMCIGGPDSTTTENLTRIGRLEEEVRRLKLCEKFVKDFTQYGFRIDTNPTRMFVKSQSPEVIEAQSSEYQWWTQYVSQAEKRLRMSALAVLQGD